MPCSANFTGRVPVLVKTSLYQYIPFDLITEPLLPVPVLFNAAVLHTVRLCSMYQYSYINLCVKREAEYKLLTQINTGTSTGTDTGKANDQYIKETMYTVDIIEVSCINNLPI